MHTPLSKISLSMLAAVEKQFETEGGYGLKPWRELTDKYKSFKEKHAPGAKILIGIKRVGNEYLTGMSGKMKKELLDPASIKIVGNRIFYNPTSTIAPYHQEGTPKMVSRPPVVTPPHLLSEWNDIMGLWVEEKIKESGLGA